MNPAASWGVDQEQSIESSDVALTLVVQNVAKQLGYFHLKPEQEQTITRWKLTLSPLHILILRQMNDFFQLTYLHQ